MENQVYLQVHNTTDYVHSVLCMPLHKRNQHFVASRYYVLKNMFLFFCFEIPFQRFLVRKYFFSNIQKYCKNFNFIFNIWPSYSTNYYKNEGGHKLQTCLSRNFDFVFTHKLRNEEGLCAVKAPKLFSVVAFKVSSRKSRTQILIWTICAINLSAG